MIDATTPVTSATWQIPSLEDIGQNLSRLAKHVLVAPYAYSQYLEGQEAAKKGGEAVSQISINASQVNILKGVRFDWSWTKVDNIEWENVVLGIVYPSSSFLYPLQGLLGMAFYGLDKVSKVAQDVINSKTLNNVTRVILVAAFVCSVRAAIIAPTPLTFAILVSLIVEFRKLRVVPQHVVVENGGPATEAQMRLMQQQLSATQELTTLLRQQRTPSAATS